MLELRTATIEVLNETNKVVPRRMCKFGERYRTMSAKPNGELVLMIIISCLTLLLEPWMVLYLYPDHLLLLD